MTQKEAIKILRKHNARRRYDGPVGQGPNIPSLEEILPGLEHPDRCTVSNAPDQMLVDELRGRGFEVTCKKVTTIIL